MYQYSDWTDRLYSNDIHYIAAEKQSHELTTVLIRSKIIHTSDRRIVQMAASL